MLLGTGLGLTAYFTVGFYVAALVSAAVSMGVVLVTTWLWPGGFQWRHLDEARIEGAPA